MVFHMSSHEIYCQGYLLYSCAVILCHFSNDLVVDSGGGTFIRGEHLLENIR